jgi:hypothetical protein
MFKFPAALLWIPSAINGYFAAMVIQMALGGRAAQADFELASYIGLISLPLAGLMGIGLVIWASMRFAARHAVSSNIAFGQLAIAALNIAAPFLLWSSLKWISM